MTTTVAPLLFSIIVLNITNPIEQYEYFYSVNIQVNTTCRSKRESNITLTFKPSLSDSNEPQKRFFFSSTNHSFIKCENLTYGVNYTIGGSIACEKQTLPLSKERKISEIGKAKYINSTFNSTSIDTLFFLPGLFYRLIIQLTNVNQTCSIKYSSRNSPFYHCSFHNLTPAQQFDLKYYSLTEDNQSSSNNFTIVHTALATVANLRIFSNSSELKQIEVIYDPPIGSYDQLILICERKSSKPPKIYSNSTICTNLIPNEWYRMYVETKQIGWESVNSTEIEFILPSIIYQERIKNNPILVVISIVSLIVAIALFYLLWRRKRTHNAPKSVQMSNNRSDSDPYIEYRYAVSIDTHSFMPNNVAASTSIIQRPVESDPLIYLSSLSLNEKKAELRDVFSQRPIADKDQEDNSDVDHEYYAVL